MKNLLLIALLLILPCYSPAEEIDYSQSENWVILPAESEDGRTPVESEFDVFYIYPTLVANPFLPYMSWKGNPEVQSKTEGFAKAQNKIFNGKARIFAPYVRQLEFTRCLKPIQAPDWNQTELKRGIDDTIAAFKYYLTHYNNGRPYILFGHSQGSSDLYELIKNTDLVSLDTGFVAAYLIGLPRLSKQTINSQLISRQIRCAEKADDTGVVVGWNTQNSHVKKSLFTVPDTYCINPLNWTTEEIAADKSLNSQSMFYDYKEENPDKRFTYQQNVCGARIDLFKGALIVDLPSNSFYDAHGLIGNGVFHVNDIFLFSGNLAQNALLRVDVWKANYKK